MLQNGDLGLWLKREIWNIASNSEISEDRGWGMKDSISRIKVCYKDDKLGISVVTHSSI